MLHCWACVVCGLLSVCVRRLTRTRTRHSSYARVKMGRRVLLSCSVEQICAVDAAVWLGGWAVC